MKILAPDYYVNFKCIADKCAHSCCIGWEIDIDADTYEFYTGIPGAFGERLRDGINHLPSPCFRLGENERCVLLNENGLCDIISTLGENALCDICYDHPRFRNFFSGRTEIGLGLVCEEACRLILQNEDTVKLTVLEDDDEAPTPDERDFFARRQELLGILQDRSRSLSERLDKLSAVYGSGEGRTPAEWSAVYRSLERLDSAWDKYLDAVSDCAQYLACSGSDTVFEQLAVYLVLRHTADSIEDGQFAQRTAFCLHAVRFIRTVCAAVGADMDEICEVCRLYSGEIEYSDENTGKLMEMM